MININTGTLNETNLVQMKWSFDTWKAAVGGLNLSVVKLQIVLI